MYHLHVYKPQQTPQALKSALTEVNEDLSLAERFAQLMHECMFHCLILAMAANAMGLFCLVKYNAAAQKLDSYTIATGLFIIISSSPKLAFT